MGVPAEIRAVDRPGNTIVQDSGVEGPKRYKVRIRKGYKKNGAGKYVPVNGKVVGYVYEGKYVAIQEKTAKKGPDCFSYGGATLAYSLSQDIFEDLTKVFEFGDCFSIINIAILKILYRNAPASRLASYYRKTYLTQYYPSASLSQNSIGNLYERLGMDMNKQHEFFNLRLKSVAAEHHIAIDGTLIEDNSIVNDLSSYSYKSREKHVSDISILYAFDIDTMEPICSAVYPGCKPDCSAYESFLKNNNIKKGILIADKAFTPNNIREILKDNKDLHYIAPMKRDDFRIDLYKMLKCTGVLKGIDGQIEYKKVETNNHLYLYMYKDFRRYCMEKETFLEKVKNDRATTGDDYDVADERFGTILLESDMDMDPAVAYKAYQERWKLEMFFKAFKQDDCINTTRVQNDYSVMGSNFVQFITSLITSRLVSKFEKAGLLEEYTFGELIEDLNFACRDVTEAEPVSFDEYWKNTDSKTFEMLEVLGLSKPNPAIVLHKQEIRKAKKNEEKEVLGRPSKPKDETVKKKGKPGRPKVRPLPDPDAPKRGPGRPRTKPLPDPNQPKRKRGRPRKTESV